MIRQQQFSLITYINQFTIIAYKNAIPKNYTAKYTNQFRNIYRPNVSRCMVHLHSKRDVLVSHNYDINIIMNGNNTSYIKPQRRQHCTTGVVVTGQQQLYWKNYSMISHVKHRRFNSYDKNHSTIRTTTNDANKTNESDTLRYTNQQKPANINTNGDKVIPIKEDVLPVATTTTTTTSTSTRTTEATGTDTIEHNDNTTNPNISAIQQTKKDPFVVVQHWIQQLQAIPNIITVSRIVLIPFISYWIITHQTVLACIGCTYAAISDVLDGYIARKYPSMQTPLGTYLDPLADKLLINSLAISLWYIGTLPSMLVGLWLVRDMILMIATHQYVAQNTTPGMAVMDPVTVPIQVIPTTISKINTALQFITLVVAITTIIPTTTATTLTSIATLATTIETPTELLLETIDNNSFNDNKNDWLLLERIYMKDTILPILCWITGGTTIGSSLSYYGHSAFISSTNMKDKKP